MPRPRLCRKIEFDPQHSIYRNVDLSISTENSLYIPYKDNIDFDDTQTTLNAVITFANGNTSDGIAYYDNNGEENAFHVVQAVKYLDSYNNEEMMFTHTDWILDNLPTSVEVNDLDGNINLYNIKVDVSDFGLNDKYMVHGILVPKTDISFNDPLFVLLQEGVSGEIENADQNCTYNVDLPAGNYTIELSGYGDNQIHDSILIIDGQFFDDSYDSFTETSSLNPIVKYNHSGGEMNIVVRGFSGNIGKYLLTVNETLPCNQDSPPSDTCNMVDISLSVSDNFGQNDDLATIDLFVENHTDQTPVLTVVGMGVTNGVELNNFGVYDIDSLELEAFNDGEKYLDHVVIEVSFEGTGDQNFIEPYTVTINGDWNLGTFTDDNNEIVLEELLESM